jgi:hypothetical protein
VKFSVVVLILLLGTTALADSVDQLAQALSDRSYNVRAQAAMVLGKLRDRRGVPLLIGALADREAAVRAVAAVSLGKLGDAAALPALRARMEDPDALVRTAVSRAITTLETGPEVSPTGPSRFSLEVSPTACSLGIPDSVRHTQRELATQLGRLRGVVLTPAPGLPRYFVDTKLAKLSVSAPDARGRVQVECDLNVIVATHPNRAIKMMATVGGNLDERNDPKGLAEAKNFCLGDAAKQAAEKVQTYLQGVR